MAKKAKEDVSNICIVCGKKDGKLREGMCRRHFSQLQEFGFAIDDAQEIKVNEIIIHSEYCELIIIDEITEEIKDRIEFDIEDIDWIKPITWYKGFEGVIGKDIEGRIVNIQNVITGTLDKVIFKDGNYKNCRKSNLEMLRVTKKKKSVMVSKKNKNKIIIESLGESHNGVVGSCFLISYPKKDGSYGKIIFEEGMCQLNGRLKEEFDINKAIVDRVPASEIEAAFISHVNIDHIGLLPSLIPNGFKGELYTSNENKELMTALLLDGAFILNKNVKHLQSKKFKVEPLYSESDVYLLLNRTRVRSKNEIHKINEYVSFRMTDTSHILGATQVELFIKTNSGSTKKIHFTGDLSINTNMQPFVEENHVVTNSTISFFEATYNDIDKHYTKQDVIRERQEMRKLIKNQVKKRGKVLIPAFAMSRTQNIMCYLYETFKDDPDMSDVPIYIDGKLSLNMNNIYLDIMTGSNKEYWKEVMAWSNFNYIKDYETSKIVALNRENPAIILSSNGMATQGRIMNHVKAMVQDRNSLIISVGYMANGTCGQQLMDENVKNVKIEGVEYIKKCSTKRFNTWSSHIQSRELINYMKQLTSGAIILHHSDNGLKDKFRDDIEKELRAVNNTSKVVCASNDNNIFYI